MRASELINELKNEIQLATAESNIERAHLIEKVKRKGKEIGIPHKEVQWFM